MCTTLGIFKNFLPALSVSIVSRNVGKSDFFRGNKNSSTSYRQFENSVLSLTQKIAYPTYFASRSTQYWFTNQIISVLPNKRYLTRLLLYCYPILFKSRLSLYSHGLNIKLIGKCNKIQGGAIKLLPLHIGT